MKPIESVLVLTLVTTCTFGAWADELVPESKPHTSQAPSISSGWDKQAAAKYLDDRIDIWFEKAKKLRTDEGGTSCVSCHTVLPYAMARPILRKATGQKNQTSQEIKLLAEVIRRVNTYSDHEPLYKSKHESSRGTEAVLNLMILAIDDSTQDRLKPSEPTRKALNELWNEQRADGAWNWLDFGLEPYESRDSVYYGAALAAIAVGFVPGYPDSSGEDGSMRLARLKKYLCEKYFSQNLYNRTWMLLASTRLNGLLNYHLKQALAGELQLQQNNDGGWSLQKLGPWTWSKTRPPFAAEGHPDAGLLCQSDGYATGLVTYALRQAGLSGAHPALKKATTWLESNQRETQIEQNRWKCWRTYSLNHDREHGGDEGEPWRRMFMSDAATAFAALALLPAD